MLQRAPRPGIFRVTGGNTNHYTTADLKTQLLEQYEQFFDDTNTHRQEHTHLLLHMLFKLLSQLLPPAAVAAAVPAVAVAPAVVPQPNSKKKKTGK